MSQKQGISIRGITEIIMIIALVMMATFVIREVVLEDNSKPLDYTDDSQALPNDELSPIPTSPEELPTTSPQCDKFIVAFDTTTGRTYCLEEGEALPPEAFQSVETMLSCYEADSRMVTDCPEWLIEFIPPTTGQAT